VLLVIGFECLKRIPAAANSNRDVEAYDRGVSDPGQSPYTGGCGCGAVRWELDEPPFKSTYCHCHRCQHRSGTGASPSGIVDAGAFRITSGEDLIKAWRPAGGHEKHFCGECGSALFSRPLDDDSVIGLRLGGFDGDPGIRPSAHQFVESAAPWEPIPDDGLPRFPGRRAD
jgi:hypothetical protein